MTGLVAATLTVAFALVVLPSSPGRRLTSPLSVPRRVPFGFAAWAAGCIAVAISVLLPPTTDLAAAMVVVTAVVRLRRRRGGRRAAAESRSLEAALDVLVGELRVGAHPVRAFSVAADETGGTVAAAFRAVAARARLGADVGAGLRSAAGSSTLPAHWERLAVCWQLAADHGLAMATLMRTAQRDIDERQRFSSHVTSKMAGARATAVILAGLPALGVALGQLIGAHPVRFLLHGHLGGWLLVVGTMLACGGLLWSDRITDQVVS